MATANLDDLLVESANWREPMEALAVGIGLDLGNADGYYLPVIRTDGAAQAGVRV